MEPRFSENKCSKFRRIDTKFGIDHALGQEWVQKQAKSLTFKIFKVAATAIFNFSPYKQWKLPKNGATFILA